MSIRTLWARKTTTKRLRARDAEAHAWSTLAGSAAMRVLAGSREHRAADFARPEDQAREDRLDLVGREEPR